MGSLKGNCTFKVPTIDGYLPGTTSVGKTRFIKSTMTLILPSIHVNPKVVDWNKQDAYWDLHDEKPVGSLATLFKARFRAGQISDGILVHQRQFRRARLSSQGIMSQSRKILAFRRPCAYWALQLEVSQARYGSHNFKMLSEAENDQVKEHWLRRVPAPPTPSKKETPTGSTTPSPRRSRNSTA